MKTWKKQSISLKVIADWNIKHLEFFTRSLVLTENASRNNQLEEMLRKLAINAYFTRNLYKKTDNLKNLHAISKYTRKFAKFM